jgi:hypothetical protein
VCSSDLFRFGELEREEEDEERLFGDLDFLLGDLDFLLGDFDFLFGDFDLLLGEPPNNPEINCSIIIFYTI